jgi:hypothetical protein
MYDQPDLITQLGPVAEGDPMALPAEDDMGAPVLRDPAGSTAQSRVRASAPPKDPRLLYVVPTFRWSRSKASGSYTATRLGNGLRIWLDRPWFTSGDGELLGIVIHSDGGDFKDIPGPMELRVTQWGTDPLWQTTAPKPVIRDADFPARVTAESLTLQEHPDDPPVRIVGHRVHWDDERALWYCDVELTPGATYMPFVRLALVRYQPNALPGAKISKVVLADFAQVLPRRKVAARRDGNALTVALHGPDPAGGPLDFTRDSAFQNVSFVNGPFETGRNRVEIVLQEQEDGIDSDLGWRDVSVLHQHVVGEDDAPGDGPILTPTPVDPLPGRVVRPRAGGRVSLPGAVSRGTGRPLAGGVALGTTLGPATGPLTTRPDIFDPFLLDPAFWEATVTVPGGRGKRRIAIREFERFYSDNIVQERIGTGTFPRRIIEERLVFADVFDPASVTG